MSNLEIIAIIIGGSIVTMLPRLLPVLIPSMGEGHPAFKRVLKFIAPTVIIALVIPEVFIRDNKLFISLHNAYIPAAIVSVIISLWKKNTLLTIAVGVFTVWAWSLVF